MINKQLNNITNILLNLERYISMFVKMGLFDVNPYELNKLTTIEQKFNWIIKQNNRNFVFHFQKPFIMEILKIVEYVIEQQLQKNEEFINEFYKNAKHRHDIKTNDRLEILYIIAIREKEYFIDKYHAFTSLFNSAIGWNSFTSKTSINCFQTHLKIMSEMASYFDIIFHQNI